MAPKPLADVRIRVEGTDPVSGSIAADAAEAVPFCGWLDLLSALTGAIDAMRMGGMSGMQDAPDEGDMTCGT